MPTGRSSLLSSEAIFFLALAAIFFGWMLSGREVAFGNGSPRFVLGEGFGFEMGVAMVLLALSAMLMRQSGTSFRAEWQLRSVVAVGMPDLWLCAALVLATGLGVSYLAQPMRYDEAFSTLFFVQGSWAESFSYPLPNNHFGYTLLERLLPAQAPAWLRIPALLGWLAAIVVAHQAARRLGGSGLLAALAMAVCPFLLLYATAARGYTLLLLFVLLIVARIAAWRPGQHVDGVALGACSAAGLFVMPSMLYALAGLALWSLCVVRAEWRRLVPWPFFTLLFTTLLYLPVLLVNRAQSIAANRFFARSSDFPGDALAHVQATLADFSRGVPAAVVAAIVVLAAIGVVRALQRGQRAAALLLPATLLGAGLLFLAKQSIPFPRTWIFFLPLLFLAADLGWRELAGARRWMDGIVLFAATVFAVQLATSRSIERYPDAGVAPDALAIARAIAPRVAGTDWLCARPPLDAPVRYYLQRDYPVEMGTPAPAQVYVLGRAPAFDVEPIGEAGIFRLRQRLPVSQFAKGYSCWLRGGHYFG
jgi:hypothetical protein